MEKIIARMVPFMKAEETLNENEMRDRAIEQFERGIILYYKRRNQEAIIEFQKVLDDYGEVVDVANKARQYIEFCKT